MINFCKGAVADFANDSIRGIDQIRMEKSESWVISDCYKFVQIDCPEL